MESASAWAAQPTSRLIVVLSSERSGSTLLRVMLGEHSRMIAPQNLNLRTFLRRIPPEHQSTVHYEDLVQRPGAVMESLCAAIGVPFEPGILRPETRQRLNPHLGDPNFHHHASIDTGSVESWRSRYDERCLRGETVQLMQQVGARRVEGIQASAA